MNSRNTEIDVNELFVEADKLSSIDRTSLTYKYETLIFESLVAESGNFPRFKKRYKLMVDMVYLCPGIRTTELMNLLNLPHTTFYRMLNKAAHEDHYIEWIRCRLNPISPMELPEILEEVHGLTLKFPAYFNRTVVEALCAYLNESELFASQYINAKPTSKTAKEENCRCITISCSNRPLNKEDLLALRALIWEFTIARFGRKVRMSISRVELNRDYFVCFGGKNSKVPCQSMTISKLYRCLARGYFKRFPDGRICFRSEVIDRFDDFDDLISTIDGHAKSHELARENMGLRKVNTTLNQEVLRLREENKRLKRLEKKSNS